MKQMPCKKPAAMKANQYLLREKFITLNADVLTDLNLHRLLAYHDEEKPITTIAVGNRITTKFTFDKINRLCSWRNNTTDRRKNISAHEQLCSQILWLCCCIWIWNFDLIYFDGKFSLIDVYLDVARSHTILALYHTEWPMVGCGKPSQ